MPVYFLEQALVHKTVVITMTIMTMGIRMIFVRSVAKVLIKYLDSFHEWS